MLKSLRMRYNHCLSIYGNSSLTISTWPIPVSYPCERGREREREGEREGGRGRGRGRGRERERERGRERERVREREREGGVMLKPIIMGQR